jgi:hypothetical protein
MQQRKHLPHHKICIKCLTTSHVGSIINVKIYIKLKRILPKYLTYLLKPQKIQFVYNTMYGQKTIKLHNLHVFLSLQGRFHLHK